MKEIQISVGRKFGNWTIVKKAEPVKNGKVSTKAWECLCLCGTKRVVRQTVLITGKSKSCGCLRIEDLKKNSLKHTKMCRVCKSQYINDYGDFTCSEKCYNNYHNNINKKKREKNPNTFDGRLKRIFDRIQYVSNKKTNITLVFLQELFNKQNKKCSISKIPFELNIVIDSFQIPSPWSISIDRINNTKGYTKDNVRLVCLMYNLAKNIWEDKDVKKLIINCYTH